MRNPCDEGVVSSAPDSRQCSASDRAGRAGGGHHRVQHDLHRRHRRERRASGAAPAARRDCRAGAVDRRGLHAVPGVADPGWGCARRSMGTTEVFVAGVLIFALASAWCGMAPDVGTADCRARQRRESARPCSCRAAWRSSARTSAKRARPRDRHMGRVHVDSRGHWTDPWRMARARVLVALDLLPQPAARRCSCWPSRGGGVPESRGEPADGRDRLARRSIGDRRSLRPRVRVDRGRKSWIFRAPL